METVGKKRHIDPVRMLAVSFARLRDILPSEDAYLQTAAWRLVFEHGSREMQAKAELAEVAHQPLTSVEIAAVGLAQAIQENTEGQPAGATSREQLLAGKAQELGENLLAMINEAEDGKSA